jgi:hypothetical protein
LNKLPPQALAAQEPNTIAIGASSPVFRDDFPAIKAPHFFAQERSEAFSGIKAEI